MPLYNINSTQGLSSLIFLINTKQVLTNSTNLTTLASKTIKASALTANSILRITALYSFTNNMNTKNIYWRIGSTNLLNLSATATQLIQSVLLQRLLVFRGAINSQVIQTNGASSYASYTTSANEYNIDFSQDQTINFLAQNAMSSDTTTLEYAFGEVIS